MYLHVNRRRIQPTTKGKTTQNKCSGREDLPTNGEKHRHPHFITCLHHHTLMLNRGTKEVLSTNKKIGPIAAESIIRQHFHPDQSKAPSLPVLDPISTGKYAIPPPPFLQTTTTCKHMRWKTLKKRQEGRIPNKRTFTHIQSLPPTRNTRCAEILPRSPTNHATAPCAYTSPIRSDPTRPNRTHYKRMTQRVV